MGIVMNGHEEETSELNSMDNLIKLFVNKKNEFGFWNAVRLSLKFVYADVERIEEIKFLKNHIYQYEIEQREIYNSHKKNGKLFERVCPICGNSKSAFFTYNTTGGEYRLCRKCDLLFMSPILNKDSLERIYTMHDAGTQKMYWRYFMDNTSLLTDKPKEIPYRIELLKQYKREGELLDFGCSFGAFLNQIKFYYNDVAGVEIDPITAKYAQEKLGLNVYNTDIFDESLDFDKKFDIVTMFQVIEHLENPKAILLKLKACLKDEGIIYIECPNYKSYSMSVLGKYHTLILGNNHITMFSLYSIHKLLKELGFEVLFSETYRFDLTVYDLIGKYLSIIHHFYHRYSYRNKFTMIFLGFINTLYTLIIGRIQKNNKNYGSYLRVIAKVKQRGDNK